MGTVRTDEQAFSNKEQLEAIEFWQSPGGRVHPLTCGTKQHPAHQEARKGYEGGFSWSNPPKQENLVGVEREDGSIVLECPTCDYVQPFSGTNLVEMVVSRHRYYKDHGDPMERWMRRASETKSASGDTAVGTASDESALEGTTEG